MSDPLCYGWGMWLATQHGFYSIVQKAPETFHVRARLKSDLENLLTVAGLSHEIETWDGADYRYRIIIGKSDFADLMAKLALALDYPNFKSQIASLPDQRPKLNAFHEIWSIMAGLQR